MAASPIALIADREPSAVRALSLTFAKAGFAVMFASDGTSVLRHLARAHTPEPDRLPIALVAVDIEIPGRSGLDIVTTARESRWRTPIVLTAFIPSMRLREELLRFGAAAVLIKPLSPLQIRRALAHIF